MRAALYYLDYHPDPDHEFIFYGATTLDGLADTYDSSITVTNYGATLRANGAVFDGIDDYLDLTPWEIGPIFSFEVYFKWDSFPSEDCLLYTSPSPRDRG